jgi:hypothetical protein
MCLLHPSYYRPIYQQGMWIKSTLTHSVMCIQSNTTDMVYLTIKETAWTLPTLYVFAHLLSIQYVLFLAAGHPGLLILRRLACACYKRFLFISILCTALFRYPNRSFLSPRIDHPIHAQVDHYYNLFRNICIFIWMHLCCYDAQ